MGVSIEVCVVLGLDLLENDNRDNHPVDPEDTGHDHRNDRFHDEVGLEHAHAANSDSALGSAVGGAEVGEDECAGDSDEAEEEG